MDRCKCWGKTKVVLTVQHCPSLASMVRDECDKITRFALDQTLITRFGKLQFSSVEFIKEEQNDVPSLPDEANAGSLPAAQ